MSKNRDKNKQAPVAPTASVETKEVATAPVVETKPVVETEVKAPVVAKEEVTASQAPAFTAEGIADQAVEVEEVKEEVVLSPLGETIAKFAEAMAPNRAASPKQIVTQQMEMYHAVEAILAKKGSAFVEAWKEMLGIVAANPTVFTDANMFRGFRDVRIPPAKRERYINLMILVMSTADPASRNVALKAIHLPTLLKDYSAEIGQSIQGFYQQR